MEAKRMAGSAGAVSISMVKKKPRSVDNSSLGGPPTKKFETYKGRQSMNLERCHRAAPFIWML
jgi:hypothetical protein